MRILGAIILASVALTTTAGCSTVEAFRAGFPRLPSAPMTDDRDDLERWSDQLDITRDNLRTYDLTRGRQVFRSGTDGAGVTISESEYPALLEAYVRARHDQIDGLCSVFFNSLQNLSSTSRWSRDQVNALAEFSSMMMGLGGAASKQLAALSGAQVLFNDSYDAASAALLISADPYRVHRAVTTAQTDFSARNPGNPISNYRQAEALVRGYAEPCTLMGVQRLISEALDSQIAGSTGSPTGLALRLNTLMSSLGDVTPPGAAALEPLEPSDLTEESLPILYWLMRLSPSDAERAAALDRLPAALRTRVEHLLGAAGPERAEIERQLEGIDQTSPSVGRAARRLQADFRAAEAARVETPPVSPTGEDQVTEAVAPGTTTGDPRPDDNTDGSTEGNRGPPA